MEAVDSSVYMKTLVSPTTPKEGTDRAYTIVIIVAAVVIITLAIKLQVSS